ncbi:MAG TPA: thiamine phosphate synthase [Candidatus Gallacutalibacter pullistercoris]|nr:thiamine phosphate synthase [Candidatus Gallacutalibacter pullistercoris]
MCKQGEGRRLICVTQRSACPDDFLTRVGLIIAQRPARIILREKGLSPEEYEALAQKLLPLCEKYGVPLMCNGPVPSFTLPGCGAQLSFQNRGLPVSGEFGVSVHAPEEAAALQESNVAYLIAGHVFPTDCKKGVPPRGLEFLQKVCQNARQPVYAIGGITPERVPSVLQAGAAGYCVMSALMKAPDPVRLIQEFYSQEETIHEL